MKKIRNAAGEVNSKLNKGPEEGGYSWRGRAVAGIAFASITSAAIFGIVKAEEHFNPFNDPVPGDSNHDKKPSPKSPEEMSDLQEPSITHYTVD